MESLLNLVKLVVFMLIDRSCTQKHFTCKYNAGGKPSTGRWKILGHRQIAIRSFRVHVHQVKNPVSAEVIFSMYGMGITRFCDLVNYSRYVQLTDTLPANCRQRSGNTPMVTISMLRLLGTVRIVCLFGRRHVICLVNKKRKNEGVTLTGYIHKYIEAT